MYWFCDCVYTRRSTLVNLIYLEIFSPSGKFRLYSDSWNLVPFFIHDLLKLSNTQDEREVKQLFHVIKLFHQNFALTLALDSIRIKSWMNSGCGGCLFMWWPNRNGYSQVLWKPHTPTHDQCRLWTLKPNNLETPEKLGKLASP